MITDRDLAITICADAEDSYYKKVKEVMRSPVVCCKENDDMNGSGRRGHDGTPHT